MTRADLDEFAACCQPGARHRRTPTRCAAEPEGRWRRFSYEEIVARDKVSLELFWLRDESLEDSANLPSQGARAGDRGRPAGGAGADRGRSGRFGG
jgi:type I restriction enzyme M protein